MNDEAESGQQRLEHSFRRLLRAYPAWYRWERGEEMLTTLMDAAHGRDRPTWAERLDVVSGGLRKHLAAASASAAVTAIFVALFAATLGATGGTLAGWQTATELPDDAAADRIVQQAIPDMDTATSGDRSLFYWENMQGEPMSTPFAINDGDDHNAGRLIYEMEHGFDDYARFHDAKTRMAAAGWNVQSVKTGSGYAEFAATRDGLDVNVTTVQDSSSLSSVYIYRATPSAVPWCTVAGLIVGGLAGWTLTNRLHLRSVDWPTRRGVIVTGLLRIGGLLLVVPTVINLYFVGASLAMPEERVAVWLGYTFDLFAYLTFLGTGVLASALLLAALPKREYLPVESAGITTLRSCP